MPLFPKPPGIIIPETLLNFFWTSETFNKSDSILIKLIFTLLWIPPWTSASSNDLYASFKSLYLQNRENKISNSDKSDDDWGNLDN